MILINDKALEKAFNRAKIGFLKNENIVFICSIAFGMNHEFTDKYPRAATNGKTIFLNPNFFKALSHKQRISVLAHEAWHPTLQHNLRIGKRDPKLYNDAGDYVINQLLVDAGLEPIILMYNGKPFQWLQNNRFKGMSTNEVYKILHEEQDGKSTSDGSNHDIIYAAEDGKKPTEEQENKQSLEAHINGSLMKAKAQIGDSESFGTLPSELERIIQKLIKPILPWGDILMRFMSDTCKEDYTWTRPNRRLMHDFYLPSQSSQALEHLTFAIDTSGSVSEEDLIKMLSEIEYIRDTFKPKKLTLIDCDTEIHNIFEVTPDTQILDLKFGGGGGTDCNPIFKYCDENDTKALIYFTDLWLQPYEGTPDYKVLWIVYDNPSATVNVGELVHYVI